MKTTITIIFLLVIFKPSTAQNTFDSAKVYTSQYYNESPIIINSFSLLESGDSIIIIDSGIVNLLYDKLVNMKDMVKYKKTKKIRRDFVPEMMNLRALFVFYKNNKKTVIGVSPQPLMFIDNLVFSKKNIRFEKIVNVYPLLYKNLFPSREEIINK